MGLRVKQPGIISLMSVEQCLMVILTGVIAFSAIAQAIFIREQSDLLRRAQDLQTKASVRIISSGGPDYEGFSIVNLSVFPITISGWIIEVEQPAVRRGTGKWTERVLPKAPAHNLQLPHRLERGDSARIAFHRDLAVNTLRRSDGTSERFRLAVQDTLGNTYRSDCWTELVSKTETAFHECPAPGFITPEETRRH